MNAFDPENPDVAHVRKLAEEIKVYAKKNNKKTFTLAELRLISKQIRERYENR